MPHSIGRHWREFRHDLPGERFIKSHHRMRQHGTRAGGIVRIALGVLLVTGGIVLLFIPGPGLLVAVFGLALLAGESRWLAHQLDRVEPPAHRAAHRLRQWWRDRSRLTHVAIIAGIVACAGAAAYGIWMFWR